MIKMGGLTILRRALVIEEHSHGGGKDGVEGFPRNAMGSVVCPGPRTQMTGDSREIC